MIYFFRCHDFVKIGFSKDPQKRLTKAATDCPYPITMIGYIEGGHDIELSIHNRFASANWAGEWFHFTDEVTDFIYSLPLMRPKPKGSGKQGAFFEYLDAERGRRKALAGALGVSASAISMWNRVPGERVVQVARFTGIPIEELRPDMFEATQ